MDRVEAPKVRTVQLRRRVEKPIVKAKQVHTLEHATRAGERGAALRTHCADNLDSGKRTGDSPRPPTQITPKGARLRLANDELDERR
jgi:hypothetical protein